MENKVTQQTHPVRVIHADEIQGVAHFYEQFAHEPLIIKGVFAHQPFLESLNRDKVEALFEGQNFQVFDWVMQDYMAIPARELFDDMRQGLARYNVVDHSVVNTPFATGFKVPTFLQWNWFLNNGFDTDSFEKSIICSPRGSFTPLHMDGYGMQGWMYLIYGKKLWEVYPPRYTPLLFDPVFKEFYHTRKHPPERFPFAPLAEKYVGTMEGGDLFFFPSGWTHQVETVEESFGIGGSVINEFQIEQNMRCWLWERTYALQGQLDLAQLLLQMPPERFCGEQGHQNAQAALAYHAAWQRRVAEIHTVDA